MATRITLGTSTLGIIGTDMEERDFWAQASGLTPVERYSLQDHEHNAWKSILGSSLSNYDDLRLLYLITIGMPADSAQSMLHSFWASLSGLTPVSGYSTDDHKAKALSTNPVVPGSGPVEYLTNGGFEDGATAWNLNATFPTSISTAQKHSGLQAVFGNNGVARVCSQSTSGGPLPLGRIYNATCWIYVTAISAATVDIRLISYGLGNNTEAQKADAINPPLNTWIKLATTLDRINPPSGTYDTGVYIELNVLSGTGNATLYADDFSILG